MATYLSRTISSLTRVGTNYWRNNKTSLTLAGLDIRRNVQEFPGLRYRNEAPSEYLLILPENLNEQPNTNEILRQPKFGEHEIDFSKLNTSLVFKGLSQTICSFENFVTDCENEDTLSNPEKSIREFFKDIEKHLYPMDTAFNILMILMNADLKNYRYQEIMDLVERYYNARNLRFKGKFKEFMENCVKNEYYSLPGIERKLVRVYHQKHPKRIDRNNVDEAMLINCKESLLKDRKKFHTNLSTANHQFNHTVDDPDILSVVSHEFDDCYDLHHKERTPLKVTIPTYGRFMKVCPDRFVRRLLWETYNRRCSPRGPTKLNNIPVISSMRSLRRRIADLSGYRSHLDFILEDSIAQSKQQILEYLNHLNKGNSSKLKDRLEELNDYAADNSFRDSSQLGIQEYDVDFWTHKYSYEILIGRSETEVRAHFPLKTVMEGLQKYLSNYMGIDLKLIPNQEDKFWAQGVQIFEVYRRNQIVGNLIYDPYQRPSASQCPVYFRLRNRCLNVDSLPTRLVCSSFNLKQTHLFLGDIASLFFCFAAAIRGLLHNFEYYELTTYGAFELEAKDLLPNLCIAHLLSDHRILQSCSDRGGSKTMDTELVSRVLNATTYFKPLSDWRELYEAHLDLEANSGLAEIKSLVREIYSIYSPFPREKDNFDYCAMHGIFAGPNDGKQFAGLYSRQLANFCISGVLSQNRADSLASIDVVKIKEFNEKLLDRLFDPSNLDTKDKVGSLVGRNFEPLESSLGVL